MPKQDDTQRSLGRIEGTLASILANLERGDKRMDDHGKRLRHVEKRQSATWIAGAALSGILVFADKIKGLFGG